MPCTPCAVFQRTGPAGAGSPAAPAAAARIQDPVHYQLEARRAMLKCIAGLFTGIKRGGSCTDLPMEECI
jgi:hypothetical protein